MDNLQGLSQRKLEEETGLGCKEGKHQAKHVKVEGEMPLASRVFEGMCKISIVDSFSSNCGLSF